MRWTSSTRKGKSWWSESTHLYTLGISISHNATRLWCHSRTHLTYTNSSSAWWVLVFEILAHNTWLMYWCYFSSGGRKLARKEHSNQKCSAALIITSSLSFSLWIWVLPSAKVIDIIQEKGTAHLTHANILWQHATHLDCSECSEWQLSVFVTSSWWCHTSAAVSLTHCSHTVLAQL